MEVLTLYSLAFQRNGVSGQPFYTALLKFEDDGNVRDNYLLTFYTKDDKQIDIESCRANDLADVTKPLRGDEMGYMMQRFLNTQMKQKEGTIYDCCINTLKN